MRQKRVLELLSLLATPWVIFLSSSLSLYLRNQDDLNYNLAVLFPFLGATVIGVIVGYGLFWDAKRHNKYLWAPWLYLMAGPGFILWNTVRNSSLLNFQDEFLALSVISAVIVSSLKLRHFAPSRAFPYFATFALLIVISDLMLFSSSNENIVASTDSHTEKIQPGALVKPEGEALPNIYHIVLDGYQSDIFDFLLTEELKTELSGFQLFPNNTSLYGKTRHSIPAVFIGRKYDSDFSYSKAKHAAFSSSDSLLGMLLDRGYKTSAFLHQEIKFSPNSFHEVRYHYEFSKRRPWSVVSFRWLWFYTYWPEFVYRAILYPNVVGRIRTGHLAPDGYPVVSLDAFRAFLSIEPYEPSVGRYVFIHVIIPHPPYRLTSDCTVVESTDALNQFKCANRLIGEFVSLLRGLNRFRESLIIIHADHGDNLLIDGGRLQEVDRGVLDELDVGFHFPRSKALLLLKQIGDDENTGFRVNETKTTLLDVAPTIAHSLGVAVQGKFEGVPMSVEKGRKDERFYFIAEGRDFRRYKIGNDALLSDEQ